MVLKGSLYGGERRGAYVDVLGRELEVLEVGDEGLVVELVVAHLEPVVEHADVVVGDDLAVHLQLLDHALELVVVQEPLQ